MNVSFSNHINLDLVRLSYQLLHDFLIALWDDSNNEVHENHVENSPSNNPDTPGKNNKGAFLFSIPIQFKIPSWKSKRHHQISKPTKSLILGERLGLENDGKNNAKLQQENHKESNKILNILENSTHHGNQETKAIINSQEEIYLQKT